MSGARGIIESTPRPAPKADSLTAHAGHWLRFRRHKVALVSPLLPRALWHRALRRVLRALRSVPARTPAHLLAPPTAVHVFGDDWTLQRPFVYGSQVELDRADIPAPLRRGPQRPLSGPPPRPRRALSLSSASSRPTCASSASTEPGAIFLAGTDALGRDLLSRMLFGARTSLFVGLLGLSIGFALGLLFGGTLRLLRRRRRHRRPAPTRVPAIAADPAALDGARRDGAERLDAGPGLFRHLDRARDHRLDLARPGHPRQAPEPARGGLRHGGEDLRRRRMRRSSPATSCPALRATSSSTSPSPCRR